jgi:glutamate synthase domain-containing protein 3
MNEPRNIKLTNGDLTFIEQALAEKHNRLIKKYLNKVKTDKEREILAVWQSLLQYISRLRYEVEKEGEIKTARKAELDEQELARIQHNLLTAMKAEFKEKGICPLCERAS